MNLAGFAMRWPIALAMVIVAVIGGGILALDQMRVDIFPAINAPQIYVVNNYAGMSPEQIEGIVTNVYEQNFQYVDGLKGVESKSIQNFVQLKLTFYPGTDMAAAMSQVVSLTNRARGQMPPSVLPPFVIRFDAANVPIGYLVMESKTRPLGELADLGLFHIRPMLIAKVPGTVSFSPYGSNTRAIVITVDPDRLRANNFTPEDVVSALETGNVVVASGNLYAQGQMPLVPTNAMVADPQELGKIPVKLGKDVYIRDVATIQDTTDINYGCALVNGRRSVYIPVVKKDTASTLTVVRQIHDTMPSFNAAVPKDVHGPLRVRRIADGACGHQERGHGRGDRRGADRPDDPALPPRPAQRDRGADQHPPVADQLVDRPVAHGEHHQHHVAGRAGPGHRHPGRRSDGDHREHPLRRCAHTDSIARAARRANATTATARLLAMLCILSVFIPTFILNEPVRSLFMPLTLAVGFAMIASYLLSSTLVPVLSVWLVRHTGKDAHREGLFDRFLARFVKVVEATVRHRWSVVAIYLVACGVLIWLVGREVGRELFPEVDAGQFVLRFRAPPGSEYELTRKCAIKILDIIDQESDGNLAMSIGYVGLGSTNTATNNILLFMRATDDGVLRVRLKEHSGVKLAELREKLRKALPDELEPWLQEPPGPGGILAQGGEGPRDGRFPSLSSRATSSAR